MEAEGVRAVLSLVQPLHSTLCYQNNTTCYSSEHHQFFSLVYLSREQYVEFLKALQKPVLYLEGDKGVTSILPPLKGKVLGATIN